MKKKIAIWLFKLARRLYPISVTVFEQKEILEPKVCAKAYSIDKNYIRHYKRDHHVKSMREALREITKETLAQAKKDSTQYYRIQDHEAESISEGWQYDCRGKG